MASILLATSVHFMWLKQTDITRLDNDEISVRLMPDTIKIDGSLLRFEGVDESDNSKVLVTYVLKEESEKQYFSKLSSCVLITGKGTTQEIASKRNLNGFDYQRYLDIIGIRQKIKLEEVDSVTPVSPTWMHPIIRLKEIRRKGIVYTEKQFEPLTALYIKALLFGYKENNPEGFQNTWRDLGIAHLFSLSGMHIYFFIFLFEFICLSFGMTREKLFSCSFLFVLCLVVLTGTGTGMVRAGIQWLIKQINQKFGIGFSQLDCWSIALFLNCLITPYVLLTVGGQLTYYLTFLIIMIYPLFSKTKNNHLKNWLFSMVLSWLSLPLIWFHFYEWNLLTFVLNTIIGSLLFLFVLPLLLICFVLSFLWQSHTFIIVERILIAIQQVGITLSDLSFFRIVTGKIPLILLVLVIGCQFYWLINWESGNKVFGRLSLSLLLLTGLVPFWKYINPQGMIAFIDVGQGDAIFVQLPFHQGNYLLDTGGVLGYEKEEWQQGSDKRGADYTVIPFLKSKGVKSLDGVFISHAHEDHFGDLDRISEEIDIKCVLFGPGSYQQTNFKKALEKESLVKSQKKVITNKNQWKQGGMTLDCLYPIHKGDGQNNDSLVMKLNLKQTSILLTGDLEKEGEDGLLRNQDLDLSADILKLGHHGSKTSSQPLFIEAVNPEVGIISCGLHNRYQHPSESTLENLEDRGINYFRTDQNGMIYSTWWYWGKGLSHVKTLK